MKCNVQHSYCVTLYPDGDDNITFSIDMSVLSPETRGLTICYDKYFTDPLYVGSVLDRLWFIDPETSRAICISYPYDFDHIFDEIQCLDEYDDDICLVLAKSIELVGHTLVLPTESDFCMDDCYPEHERPAFD